MAEKREVLEVDCTTGMQTRRAFTRLEEDDLVRRVADDKAITAAAAAARDAVKAIAQSAVGVAVNDLTTQQLKSMVAVLLWKAGAVDSDLTIKPLGEWTK